MLFALLAVFLTAFIITLLVSPSIINKEIDAGIVGKDMHKSGNEKVANMGGFAVVIGVAAAIVLAIGLRTFFHTSINLTITLAGLVTILLINLMGIFDDLFEMRQLIKALLPLFASIPLIAISAGYTIMDVPFFGPMDFGIIYLIALIPLGVAVASNLTNMLAGFNGNEVGMGIVIFLTSSYIAFMNNEVESLFISIAMLGALIAFLKFNWYPAKAFPGDVLNLMIGGTLAVVVIIGNFEKIGFILMIPYIIDWFIKAKNRFPKSFAVYNSSDGKLYAPSGKTRGLADLLLRISGGMKETHLTLTLIFIEIIFAVIALLI
ncbi:MAG: glycosyltransferase 4 family protein [Candidatus Micrarchaeia archaeon]|jgi:UDP-N-acetylglucosamine--dolichyl-phosphate N-acetylglucosaminephosphotransferase